jgi:hypothetical protein
MHSLTHAFTDPCIQDLKTLAQKVMLHPILVNSLATAFEHMTPLGHAYIE